MANKTIYSGHAKNQYILGNFERLMKNFEGAKMISRAGNDFETILYSYYIEPQNVTLQYQNKSDGPDSEVKVVLYGHEKDISEIEKKIAEGAKK